MITKINGKNVRKCVRGFLSPLTSYLSPLTSYLSPLTYLCSRARKYGKKEVLQVLLEVITS